MTDELIDLSATRWRFAVGRRTFYIRQLKAPNEAACERGYYEVDGGRNDIRWVAAGSVEQVADELSREVSPKRQPPIP
ncbi:MAG: hypothetical protein FJ304_24375 [Planctomycetes bacterium]|nr:hypothetical protein [Planctomycetota bacterium]